MRKVKAMNDVAIYNAARSAWPQRRLVKAAEHGRCCGPSAWNAWNTRWNALRLCYGIYAHIYGVYSVGSNSRFPVKIKESLAPCCALQSEGAALLLPAGACRKHWSCC